MISHSEISTYLECQKKWELIYKDGLKLDNIHLQFGNMAHKVLDDRVIPDEELYPELKDFFKISSWNNYFNSIFEEIDNLLKDYEIIDREIRLENEDFGLKGIVDLVVKKDDLYYIFDFKFSNTKRDYNDIRLDEQLYIYAILYGLENNLDLSRIRIGYITIPKQEINAPRMLKNGTLSKNKQQATTYRKYLQAIEENGLDIEDYLDFLDELKERNIIALYENSINMEVLERIVKNIDNVMTDMKKGYVLEQSSSYLCGRCLLREYCKKR